MIRINIETGNAAFEDDREGEIARILREAAQRIEQGHKVFILRDINGNSVGKVEGL